MIIGADLSSQKLALVAGFDDGSLDPPLQAAALYTLGAGAFTPVKLSRASFAVDEFLGTLNLTRSTGELRTAVVEAPLVSGRGRAGRMGVQATIKQAYVSGVVQEAFLRAGFDVVLANVQSWKVTVIGDGRADKQAVDQCLRGLRRTSYERLAALAGLSGSAPGQDLVDALGIHSFGLGLLDRARGVDVRFSVQGPHRTVLPAAG